MEKLACREQAGNDQALMVIPAGTAEQTFARLNFEGSLMKPFKVCKNTLSELISYI